MNSNIAKTVTVSVSKANPTCNAPTGIQVKYGQKLENVSITNPSGNTDGTWSWESPNQYVGALGTKTFLATFSPTDTGNYNTITGNAVYITVEPKDLNITSQIQKGRTLLSTQPQNDIQTGNQALSALSQNEVFTVQYRTESYIPSELNMEHKLVSSINFPLNTKITLQDYSLPEPIYYYYVVNNTGIKTINLTNFTKIDENKNYTEPTFETSLIDNYIFIIDFSEVAPENYLSKYAQTSQNKLKIRLDTQPSLESETGEVTINSITDLTVNTGTISSSGTSCTINVKGDTSKNIYLLFKLLDSSSNQISLNSNNTVTTSSGNAQLTRGLAILDLGKAKSSSTTYTVSNINVSNLPKGNYQLNISLCVTDANNKDYPLNDLIASTIIQISV